MSDTGDKKLERKPQPDVYCPTCLGYGMITLKDYVLGSKEKKTVATSMCPRCCGSGWVKAEK